jgi:L-2-hydroxycarboxylate dehydrogenase (NAD+)
VRRCFVTGRPLDPDTALDARGHPTTDPSEALAGTFLTWGGARGSCLAFASQLLGILAGNDPVLYETRNSGFFFLALRPDLLIPSDVFAERVQALREAVQRSRPAEGFSEVRMPGDRSQQARRANVDAPVSVDDAVYARLLELAGDDSGPG